MSELVCPYCGEPAEPDIDPGAPEAQEFVQDCAVCCRPWHVCVSPGEDEPVVTLEREDD